MKKFINILINFILICVLLFSGYKIFTKLQEYRKADTVYNNIRDKANETDDKSIELSKINPDYRAWIKVENTNIDYPVVQSEDNEYYLTHDFNKNYLASGSIFMDYRNNFENDKSVLIYGHHMRNKTMFGEVLNFKKEEFFKENNLITIEYKGKTYTYEVFSTFVADLSKDNLKVNFDDDEDYQDYIDYLKDRSLFDSDIEVSSNDRIITLYTCSYEFEGARTLAHAKLISVK